MCKDYSAQNETNRQKNMFPDDFCAIFDVKKSYNRVDCLIVRWVYRYLHQVYPVGLRNIE